MFVDPPSLTDGGTQALVWTHYGKLDSRPPGPDPRRWFAAPHEATGTLEAIVPVSGHLQPDLWNAPRRDVLVQAQVFALVYALARRFDDWDATLMMRICAAESGLRNDAIGGAGEAGLCQIHPVHGYSREELSDPAVNIAVAHDVWLSQGYGAWSVYRP